MRKEYLKIRDDVDLKELEKFGFIKYRYNTFYENNKIRVCANKHIRIIAKGTPYDICAIFDLIQAGLVEKVVEDE